MAERKKQVIQKIHQDALGKQIDDLIQLHIDNLDYNSVTYAVLMRIDNPILTEEEAKPFIEGFANCKQTPKACEIAEDHSASKETLEWILSMAIEKGSTEGFKRALALLNRDPTPDEIYSLIKNSPRRQK